MDRECVCLGKKNLEKKLGKKTWKKKLEFFFVSGKKRERERERKKKGRQTIIYENIVSDFWC